MNKRTYRIAAAPILFAGLALPMMGGCDELSNPLDALCCEDFKPGTNMLTVDWGLEGNANLEFGATLQAVGDFSATATAMVNDLGTACKGLTLELGGTATLTDAEAADPNTFATKWCAAAATAVASIKAEAALTFSIQPPRCEVSVDAKLSCEGSCSGSAKCELTPGEIKASCEPGKLSGSCSAECTGTCEGSANLAVNCEGSCEGTCEGTCSGTQNGGQCDGTCTGKCRGSCAASGSATVKCDGTCTGECSAEFTAPKCTGEFTPPSGKCEASAECKGSCDASASAKAECTPPSVDINFTGGVEFEAKVAALKKWLPQIFLVAEGKFPILEAQISAMSNITAGFEASLEGDGAAVFCIPQVVEAVVTAGASIVATGQASVQVTGAVTGG